MVISCSWSLSASLLSNVFIHQSGKKIVSFSHFFDSSQNKYFTNAKVLEFADSSECYEGGCHR